MKQITEEVFILSVISAKKLVTKRQLVSSDRDNEGQEVTIKVRKNF